jgi:hypothetical protein
VSGTKSTEVSPSNKDEELLTELEWLRHRLQTVTSEDAPNLCTGLRLEEVEDEDNFEMQTHQQQQQEQQPQLTHVSSPLWDLLEDKEESLASAQSIAFEAEKNGLENMPTTLLVWNVPHSYTQRQLIGELEKLGLGGQFDFLYAPLDKGVKANVGFAVVNFVSHVCTLRALEVLPGHYFRGHGKNRGKFATVTVAPVQGLSQNMRHWEQSVVNSGKQRQRRPVVVALIHGIL